MTVSAVITADIVNSTKLSKPDEKKLLKALEVIFRNQKLEFYRGDSFQVFLKEPSEAFKLTMRARSAALKLVPDLSVPLFDVRASIGVGEVLLPVRSLKTASGKAFVLSGRAFDELRAEQRFSIQCQDDHKAINEGFKVISLFADYLFGQLTAKQAAVVSELLLGSSQFEVSRRLKKSQSTINKHTHASGWIQIDRLLAHYKNLIQLIPS